MRGARMYSTARNETKTKHLDRLARCPRIQPNAQTPETTPITAGATKAVVCESFTFDGSSGQAEIKAQKDKMAGRNVPRLFKVHWFPGRFESASTPKASVSAAAAEMGIYLHAIHGARSLSTISRRKSMSNRQLGKRQRRSHANVKSSVRPTNQTR